MKIAFFADTYFPHMNGIVTSVDSLYQLLKNSGKEIYLFVPSASDFQDNDSNIFRIPSLRISPKLPQQVRIPLPIPSGSYKKIFTLKYDIVHTHGSGFFSLIGIIAAKIRGVPVVSTFHTDFSKYAHYVFFLNPSNINWFLKLMSNQVNLNIVPSEKTNQLLLQIGVKKPIQVVPGFIDIKKFEGIEKSFLRSKLNIPKSDSILLSVGRFGKEKRFDFLIQVLKQVLSKIPRCHLVIVGEGPDKENLENTAHKLGVEKNVHIIGPIKYEDMPKIYADSDLFIFASDTETQGLSVLEAAASGLPLVLYNDPAYAGIAQNNVNAFLLPFSESDFTDKILELLNNKSLYQSFSENSKKIAKENFEPKIILSKLIKLYTEFAS